MARFLLSIINTCRFLLINCIVSIHYHTIYIHTHICSLFTYLLSSKANPNNPSSLFFRLIQNSSLSLSKTLLILIQEMDGQIRNYSCASHENHKEDMDVRKGPWTVEEDNILTNYVIINGEGSWNSVARCAGQYIYLAILTLHYTSSITHNIYTLAWIPRNFTA